ncbi:sensor histidine kinase [Caldinitratiruptor microaerophilus]|uniref:histidine kinase n=1 Tax=Caldinitratiruptor microaerophilus TaxID=671077 RepID=A0AA35CKR2_9FIRM|nr:HAMP domain-containing sensor histidine kinase [Caldinitratiruptor microaerophilus]BDG60223.1 hypothetical protein caldi_13130 [Caldinitratiruptor microaerophilus]
MRISTRLLLTYLLAVALVGGALTLAVPRLVRAQLLRSTADQLAVRAQDAGRRLLRVPRTAVLQFTAGVLGADAILVDSNLRVVRVVSDYPPAQALEGATLVGPEAQLVRRALGEGHGVGAVLSGRLGVVAGAAPLALPGGPPVGAIVLFQAVEPLEPALRQTERLVAAWTVAGLVAAAVLASLMSRMIVRRLTAVTEAARAAAEGDLTRRVPEEGADELADLARSFNHMAERVQNLVEGLRRSEALRRDLIASISHELRTPVTSVRGFAEALRDGVVPPAERERYYGIIAAESARLSRLIQDLFDLARLEAGQLELRMQPVAVDDWLRAFADRAGPVLAQSGTVLVLEPPPVPGPWIYADPERLDQVLHNLVENAVRHSPPGEPVRIDRVLDGGEVRIRVTDRGPGVPPEERDRIWQRFYQAPGPDGRKGGAGLGLSIVKSIVEAHGGRVGVEPAPGGGARFWFALPALPPRGPHGPA